MNTLIRRVALAVLFTATVADVAPAQALTDLTSLYVGYNTRKNQLKPQGELKARLDTIELALAVATRTSQTEEIRRLLAKGNVVLAGRAWTDSLDFVTSLRLRSEQQIIDPRRSYVLRVEQVYTPTLRPAHALSARVTLRKRPVGTGAAMQLGDVVKDFPVVAGNRAPTVTAPLSMPLDLRGVPDGNYVFYADVTDSAGAFARPALAVIVRDGIEEHAKALEIAAAGAPAALRGDLLYAVDRMRNVNRGQLQLGTFDTDREFASADSLLAAVKANKDPYAGKTGDIKRHYVLDGANEVMPYRVYVPSNYTPSKAMPLIVVLHGLGATEDSFFDGYGRALPRLAEANGYIVVAPLGYRVDGFYGSGVGISAQDAAAKKKSDYSEADVLQSLGLVRKSYTIDEHRIYLVGHSMGAIGTWYLAAKYPAMWAGLGVFSGQSNPANADKMKSIPEFVVHGDADATVNVNGSRTMITALKGAGADVLYTEVPGGSHVSVVEPNLAAMFEFFAAHKKQSP